MWTRKKDNVGGLLAAMVEASVWIEFQDAETQLQGVGILLLERVYQELDRDHSLGVKGILAAKLSEALKKSGRMAGIPPLEVTYLFDWNSVEPGPDEFRVDKDRTLKIWGGAMEILREEVKVL